MVDAFAKRGFNHSAKSGVSPVNVPPRVADLLRQRLCLERPHLAESGQLQVPTRLAMPHEVFIDTLMCSLSSELFLSRYRVA